MSSIEFKEVYIVEANNSGTATIDGVNQVTKQKHGCGKSFIWFTTDFVRQTNEMWKMVHYSSLLNSTKILNVFPNYVI